MDCYVKITEGQAILSLVWCRLQDVEAVMARAYEQAGRIGRTDGTVRGSRVRVAAWSPVNRACVDEPRWIHEAWPVEGETRIPYGAGGEPRRLRREEVQ